MKLLITQSIWVLKDDGYLMIEDWNALSNKIPHCLGAE